MKALIFINLIALGAIGAFVFFLMADWRLSLTILAVAFVIALSGALSAYLWFKRGKIYERRGESGPDD